MSAWQFSRMLFAGAVLVGSISAVTAQDAPPAGPPNEVRRPKPGDDSNGPPGPPPERRDDQPQTLGGPRRGPRPEGHRGPRENGPPRPLGSDGDRPRGRFGGGADDFESLKTRDPELFNAMQEDRDLERQSLDQAAEYRRAGKDEQPKIKTKLIEIVNKHFEVRQQLRNLEVKRLEQQLKELRERIDQRTKNRKEIVDKRIIELTGSDEGEHF